MKSFKDMNIKAPERTFIGDKVKILKILNREITVFSYKIEPSKHNSGNCLCLQIAIGEIKYVVFTGSKCLMEMIEKVAKEDFPFKTTITKEDDQFIFT